MAIDERPPEVAEEESLPTEAAPVEAAPAVRIPARPVAPAERVGPVDVLRGVALLGILVMNIVDFAWPGGVYSIPVLDPGAGPLDSMLWAFNHLVFDTKTMTLFSMLFGAGLVLMSDRADGRGARLGWVYYRRSFWLLVIGLVHAYLIWGGDILVMYASCAFLLFPFRKLQPRTLIITGVMFNLILVPLLLGFRFVGVPYMRSTYVRVEEKVKAGKKPTGWERKVHDGWKEMSKEEMPKRDDFLKDIAQHRGPYPSLVKWRVSQLIWGQTLGFVFGGWWFAGGRMLIGMGLMKLGVFAATCSRGFYVVMMLVGYGVGLPLMAFDAYHEIAHNFFLGHRLWYALDGWPFLTFYGSLPVVFGHIGAVMLVCKSGALTWLTRRLAAVGRMALSNYLFASLLCTTLFYGYGLDLYGTIHRPLLWAIVLAVWVGHLLICPLWLEVFRYGPAEWAWRSLTYWKVQPVRASSA
jgi:uncharacterized protein